MAASARADGDAAHAFLDERFRADGTSCTPAIALDGNIEPAAGGRADAHPPPDDRVGSLAALQEIFAQYGADSRVGRIASVLMGSSETIFYTMSVYLGAAGVKKLPGALGVSLLSYLTCAWVCGLIC